MMSGALPRDKQNRSLTTCHTGNSPTISNTEQKVTHHSPPTKESIKPCICLGIDPGCKGGIVALYPDKILTASLVKMDRYDIRNWIEARNGYAKVFGLPVYCFLERVGGFIGGDEDGQRRNVAAAHTTFRLGESFGMLQMILVCCRISFQEILPRDWQGKIGVEPRQKGEPPNRFKSRLKERAKQLFPEEKITLQTSDAYLLAYLCRRTFR